MADVNEAKRQVVEQFKRLRSSAVEILRLINSDEVSFRSNGVDETANIRADLERDIANWDAFIAQCEKELNSGG